jgi:hypothetical protein
LAPSNWARACRASGLHKLDFYDKVRTLDDPPEIPAQKHHAKIVSLPFIAHVLLPIVGWEALGQVQGTPYAAMAPLDQYWMWDENSEIALARSAAPPSISRDATVLALDKSGYEIAAEGKNGFTCLVERSWMSPFDSPEFWNPKMREPICYNPAAVRTILPYTINRTKLALTGLSKAQIRENITAAIAKSELPMPEAGAMSYMISKAGNLGDSVGHGCPHLMFMFPRQTTRIGEQT